MATNFASGPARSPQIPAHHDGDVAATHFAAACSWKTFLSDYSQLLGTLQWLSKNSNWITPLLMSIGLCWNLDCYKTNCGAPVIVGQLQCWQENWRICGSADFYICRSRFDFDVGLSVDVETVEPVGEREVPLVQITPPPSTSSPHQSLNWSSCFENALFA